MKKALLLLAIVGLLFASTTLHAEEVVLFDFEGGLQGWEIPDWAYEKPDYVQIDIDRSTDVAVEGEGSLMLMADYPGGRWTAAIAEIMQFFDWTDYSTISCEIFLPADAPTGLKAKIILTVGERWKWVEMSRSYALIPGEWTTLSGDLLPESIDWRRVKVDEAFRQDVRKIDIRVTSNNKPAYTGPIFIDKIKVN